MSLYVRPIECWLPILNVEVFVGPCLIIGVVVGEVDSAVVVEIIFGVPVAQGQLRRDRAIVV